MKEFISVYSAILTCLFLSVAEATAQDKSEPSLGQQNNATYGYYYKEDFVSLSASKRYVAIKEEGAKLTDFVATQGLTRDRLSDLAPLEERDLGLYRLPAPKGNTNSQVDPQALINQFSQGTQNEIQPVFEQGQALLIPSDELIVRFKNTVNLDEAKTHLAPHMHTQGIVDVQKHRKNTYILRIANPNNGRVYHVSQFLTKLNAVDFAEPNHIIILLNEPEVPAPESPEIRKSEKVDAILSAEKKRSTLLDPLSKRKPPDVWTILVHENFEGQSPPSGWTTGRWSDHYADAYWSITDHRSHSGRKSYYATGAGSGGVVPPGNYPNLSFSWLDTPLLDLAAYEEVYIEFWFYAKYEDPDFCRIRDYGLIGIYEPASNSTTAFYLKGRGSEMAICNTGDLTADPTTDNGWRRALYRVPPSLRRNGVKVRFMFRSNVFVTDEGLYIDEVRIVGAREIDRWPIGNDTYSARQYELRNRGQIAGLGGDDNDMHVPEAWNLIAVSPEVVVAVIDSGVDTHPDLNLDTGYDPDGSIGGYARGSHGTAVAGNVGGIRNNSVGVTGTAPGVRIMPVYMGASNAEFAHAIDVAVEKGADILSNSWGLTAPFEDIEAAIKDALDAGRVVLFAAGNGPVGDPWTYDVLFPSNLTGSTDLISVGASSPTDEHKGAASSDGRFFWGSSYIGYGPDIVAPSSWSYTTDRQGPDGYNTSYARDIPSQDAIEITLIDPADATSEDYTPAFGGTSSSTPKVAGVAALMLSANPELTPGQVKKILRDTADDIDLPGDDDKTGAGRVNARRAVWAASMHPILSATPDSIDFGEVAVNEISPVRELSVTNTSTQHVEVLRVMLGISDTDARFSFLTAPILPLTLLPGKPELIGAAIARPTKQGILDGSLWILYRIKDDRKKPNVPKVLVVPLAVEGVY